MPHHNTFPETRGPLAREPRAGQAKVPPIAVLLLVMVAALLGGTLYLYLELKTTKRQLAERLQMHDEQIALLEGTVNRASQQVEGQVKQVKTLVESAEEELDQKAQQVEQKVLGRTQVLQKEIEAAKKQQQEAMQDVTGRIQEVRQVASLTDSKVGSLAGRVEGVQSEVDQAKEELDRTIRDLKTVTGDLGVQSGLIATTAEELAALKRLGERNYYEFDLTKNSDPQRVGSISIRLRDANEGKNQYTMDIWVDDNRIRKKNKNLLEPVQFYVLGSRVPYEILVNKLEKNRIAGYLSTPKDEPGRTKAAGSTE